jgi:hypothetical protein
MSRWLIVCSVAAIVLFFAIIDPIAQDPAYHDFADTRRMLGVANFWNVASNLPFLVVGLAGLGVLAARPDLVASSQLRGPWIVFFSGIALTAFGSGYFHLAPSDASLVWDRLAMTVGFAGLFAIVIGEYISPRAAARLLLPFVLVGVLSVLYWITTESAGVGDLRPYVIVQFLPVLLIPVILVLRRDASDLTPALWIMVGFYVLAKLLEHFDDGIYVITSTLSGHTLKHIAAALAPVVLIRALLKRHREHANDSENL